MLVGLIPHHYAHLVRKICSQYFLRPNSESTCSNVRNVRIVSCFCNGMSAGGATISRSTRRLPTRKSICSKHTLRITCTSAESKARSVGRLVARRGPQPYNQSPHGACFALCRGTGYPERVLCADRPPCGQSP